MIGMNFIARHGIKALVALVAIKIEVNGGG
jgi:hypothetical protein